MLRSRLIYKVQRPIGQQTLIADGVGQNLLGLLNEAGIGATPRKRRSRPAMLKGKTMVLMSDAVPNGIVLHP